MEVAPGRPDPDASGPVAADPFAALLATDASAQLAQWGFVCHSDLPDAPGPALLLVALRPAPTLRHFDPEKVDYWVIERGRGRRRTLTQESRMPWSEDYSWGLIRLVDRLRISNEIVTFGGRLDASIVGRRCRRRVRVAGAAIATWRPLAGPGRRRRCDRSLLREDDGCSRLQPRLRIDIRSSRAPDEVRGVRD